MPDEQEKEPTLDDLIAMIQTGAKELPKPEVLIATKDGKVKPASSLAQHKVTPANKPFLNMPTPKKFTIGKPIKTNNDLALEVPEQEAVDAAMPKDETDEMIAAVQKSMNVKSLLTPQSQTKDWLRFNLGKHAKYGYDTLVVYITPEGRMKALLDEPKPLDEGTLWMHYNVSAVSLVNNVGEPIDCYGIEDYDYFTEHGFKLKPGQTWECSGIKHLIVTSAKAKRLKNFEFLKTWMPV